MVLGFGTGFVLSGIAAALIAELKYFIEHGRASRIFEFLPEFSEQFGGDFMKPVNEEMLDEMIELAELDESVRTRRLFRESGSSELRGEGNSSIYFDEE